jgi:hypothetical protein
MYSAVAAGANQRETTSGALLADGMLRLVTGTEVVNAGPGSVSEIVTALKDSNTKVHLRGALGLLDFDVKTGGPRGGGSIWCAKDDALTITMDVARYNPATGGYDEAELAQCAAF